MSDESRADRLRRRRQEQRDQQTDSAEPSEPSEPTATSKSSEPSKPSQPSNPDELADSSERAKSGGAETTSVKDDRVGTYMYLPEDQRSELDFAYKELSLTYEREFGEELEKNRHFYPMLVQAGLERLDGLDGAELQALLDELRE